MLVGAVYLGFSIASVIAYAVDKSAARRRRRRIPERMLLLLGLMGGWPGTIVAQRTLRHKTRKKPFQTVFWLTVVLNIAGLVALQAALQS